MLQAMFRIANALERIAAALEKMTNKKSISDIAHMKGVD